MTHVVTESLGTLNELAQRVHANAVEKGFWDNPPSFGDVIALIHSELSEALEEYRDGRDINETYSMITADDANPTGIVKPMGIPSEFADVIIRVLDVCAAYEIDIDAIVAAKVEYNAKRPRMHGRVM